METRLASHQQAAHGSLHARPVVHLLKQLKPVVFPLPFLCSGGGLELHGYFNTAQVNSTGAGSGAIRLQWVSDLVQVNQLYWTDLIVSVNGDQLNIAGRATGNARVYYNGDYCNVRGTTPSDAPLPKSPSSSDTVLDGPICVLDEDKVLNYEVVKDQFSWSCGQWAGQPLKCCASTQAYFLSSATCMPSSSYDQNVVTLPCISDLRVVNMNQYL